MSEGKRYDEIQGKIVHVYDGIEEADNDLPKWWLWTLYGAIVFAIGYWFYYQEFRIGKTPVEAYEAAAAASATTTADIDPTKLAEAATNPQAIAAGQGVFATNCAVCHGDKAEGKIGPNLTDDRWLHGGSGVDIYRTIFEGVPSKGMPNWGPTLGAKSVEDVTAYVMSLRGTNVPGKPPEGEPWSGDAAGGAPAEDTAAGADAGSGPSAADTNAADANAAAPGPASPATPTNAP